MLENTYTIFQYFKNKQKTFCHWPSLAAWRSGVTTTGNGIFVCYDNNQQQEASMLCHAMPFQYKAITTTNTHGVKG